MNQEPKYRLCSTQINKDDLELRNKGHLVQRNKGHLEYELKCEDITFEGNNFRRYKLFDNLDFKSTMEEKTHNHINYFDCEGEYSRIIGISLYNEDYNQLESTLISIFKNRLTASDKEDYLMSKTLIIIISDGFEQLPQTTKEKLKEFGLYDDDLLQKKLKEYTMIDHKNIPDTTFFFQGELGCYPEGKTPDPSDTAMTSRNIMKIVFAAKIKNRKKLHSHLLLFMLCARKLKPEFIILLDTGTVPRDDAISILIKAMMEDVQISGCCGELEIELPNDSNNAIESQPWYYISEKSMILKAQWLEYKFAHSLQKTFESSCGFVPVLPGAFCAYRWSALIAKDYYVVKEYLKPFNEPHTLGWTQSNIYHLAEDRVILDKISKLDTETSSSCWSSGHFLTFVRGSKATTDGPDSILKLINQRRRWNNGAWFSLNETLWKKCNTWLICKTKHSPTRKLILILQVLYYILLVSFQWCSVGAFYLAFAMALRKIITDPDQQSYLLPTFEGIYLILTFCLFCMSLVIDSKDLNDNIVANRGIRRNRLGSLIFNFLAFFYFMVLLYIVSVLLYVLIAVGFENSVYLIVLIIVPCTLVISLLMYDCRSIKNYAICAFPYVYYIPTYINILQIYAICKTDDVSWGTRGDPENDYNSKFENFKYKKFFYLITYVISNSIFGFLFEKFYANGASGVLGFLYGAALILILIPFAGEIYYMTLHFLNSCKKPTVDPQPVDVNFDGFEMNSGNQSHNQTSSVSPHIKP